jgi:hypothetical protein
MAAPSFVGTRPQRARDATYTRDSNALRASVLDAALELGVGTSRAVENLIFDSILEDDEVGILSSCSRCLLGPHHRARISEIVAYGVRQPIGHMVPFFSLSLFSPTSGAAPLGVANHATLDCPRAVALRVWDFLVGIV